MNKEKNRTPVLVDMLSLKVPTTEDYQKAFDKLTRQQKGNAIRFGSLSDQHIVWLKESFYWPKNTLKHRKQNPLIDQLFADINDCAQYTGCKPWGNGELNEKTYNQWRKNRVKARNE